MFLLLRMGTVIFECSYYCIAICMLFLRARPGAVGEKLAFPARIATFAGFVIFV